MNNIGSTIIADTGLTTEQITTASRHLSVTRAFLIESVSGLSPAQWDFKPFPDSWSIAENVEHIVLIESRHPFHHRKSEPRSRGGAGSQPKRDGRLHPERDSKTFAKR